jgi:hypothetical protein
MTTKTGTGIVAAISQALEQALAPAVLAGPVVQAEHLSKRFGVGRNVT